MGTMANIVIWTLLICIIGIFSFSKFSLIKKMSEWDFQKIMHASIAAFFIVVTFFLFIDRTFELFGMRTKIECELGNVKKTKVVYGIDNKNVKKTLNDVMFPDKND